MPDLDESEEINACSVKITVDVDGIEYTPITRKTWTRGVFRDIMKKLNTCKKEPKTTKSKDSKYLHQEKTMGDYVCKVIEYKKNKVLVEEKGYYGEDWMCVSTWKKASVEGFAKRIKEKFTKKCKKTLNVFFYLQNYSTFVPDFAHYRVYRRSLRRFSRGTKKYSQKFGGLKNCSYFCNPKRALPM